MPPTPVEHPPRRRATRVAVVVGSQHPRTEAQLDELNRFDHGCDVVVHRVDPRDGAAVQDVAGWLVAVDGLVLTGGHTARAVLDALRVTAFTVGGEVEVGVPWSVATTGLDVTIVTKAGGFGDATTLRRAVEFLTVP
jgi:uncharacterized protein YgbK (DUF1537 family)